MFLCRLSLSETLLFVVGLLFCWWRIGFHGFVIDLWRFVLRLGLGLVCFFGFWFGLGLTSDFI